MDVRLPDGTIVRNVPDGTTKEQLTEKLKANGYDVSKLEAPKAPEPQTQDTAKGIFSEGTKGLFRGAGLTASLIPQGLSQVLPGPLGPLARQGFESLVAPSRGLVKPTPTTPTEQMVGTGGEIAGSILAGGPTSFKNALLPAVGGAVGEQFGGETGKLVGSLLPTAGQLGGSLIKGAMSKNVPENLRTFKQAGTLPSVGQATENSFMQGLENLAAKFPGGAGTMKRFMEGQQKAMGGVARTGVTAEDAGRAIEKGIRGEGGFLERTRSTWARLDNQLAAKAGNAVVVPKNTIQALESLTTPVAGAQKTTSALINPKLAQMRENLSADMQASGGQLPFKALRELRTKVGSMLDDALVSDVPTGELKKVYKGLTQDLGEAAKAAGAEREFTRQANFYRARMSRIDDVLDRVIGKGKQPEDIFKAINPTNPDQAGKLRATMRSLSESERKTVTEAMVNRLGKATPGRQDELGEIFSSNTFLTNWNKLSSQAKSMLFPSPPMRENVEHIAKAADNIKRGAGIFANPSGTAGSFAAYSIYSSPMTALAAGMVGGPPAAAGVLGAAGGAAGTAYVGSKMLTSPKVVEWLAKPVKSGEHAAHLARLGVLYSQITDPELKAELEKFVTSAAQK